ncbi:two-component sensor histidine kinase [Deferribacter desulfuricans SSM1]|uniref:histidine kinase n=1 Tax=Deferribacter desulfuricans (strain DSM 14783 / JCM 11476 / NBRC 101012 / SSM1) TaxID=639282 RepID=D3PE24_DEFDS|nr:HAMP domain-containing sensor histidine kinase [Deferribacter desulfuricans]BAI80847.1 two-component sensor histidine kinase [Deferribacter desulfuricans SSM1]
MFYKFIIYIFYGLSFFVLGFSIILKDKSFSKLDFLYDLNYLALFAIIHGFHEWIDLYLFFTSNILHKPELQNWYTFKYILLSLSYSFLMVFGVKIFLYIIKTKLNKIKNLSLIISVLLISFVVCYISINLNSESFIRILLGFSSAFLSGISMFILSIRYKKSLYDAYYNLRICGILFIIYSLIGGLLSTDTRVGPFNMIVYRSIVAILTFFFLFRFLKIFDIEFIKKVEQKLKNVALNEKLTSLGRLAMGIAHEINTPLTNASLTLELIRKRIPQDSKLLDKLSMLEANIDRASLIAKELLLFSKDDNLDFQDIKIENIINNSLMFIGNHKRYRQIVVFIKENCDIECIPHKIEELIINLLLNAFDAIDDNGLIKIISNCDKEYIYFEIADNGTGISQEILDKVFDPFFTTKGPNFGTGMGLYICYNIVKLHKGEINIDSEVGKGTIVRIKLPRKQR